MTFSRTLLLLELARTEAALLQAAGTDVLRRAMLAARRQRISMRLGLAVPAGELTDALDKPEREPAG